MERSASDQGPAAPEPEEGRATPVARRLLARLGVAVLAFALLGLAWPLVSGFYPPWFRSTVGVALYVVGVEGLSIEALPGDPNFDTRVQYEEGGTGWALSFDARTTGYFPTALFLALWLAAPIPRRRRERTLLWGLLWIHVFVLAQVGTILLWRFTVHVAEMPDHDHLAMFSQRWWLFTGRTLYELVPGITARAVVPIVVCAGVAARREDWTAVLGGGGVTSGIHDPNIGAMAPRRGATQDEGSRRDGPAGRR